MSLTIIIRAEMFHTLTEPKMVSDRNRTYGLAVVPKGVTTNVVTYCHGYYFFLNDGILAKNSYYFGKLH